MEDGLKTAILLLGHGSNLEDANESLHEVARLIKAVDDCYIVEYESIFLLIC